MDDFKIPPHQLIFDEERLLVLIKATEKFTYQQKLKILENIPQMKQWQIDDLLTDLEDWKNNISQQNSTEINPDSLLKNLNEKAVGQDEAKKRLVLAFYEHLIIKKDDSSYLKPNLLLVGPTGSGKTFMVSELAKSMNFPFVVANAAGMVSSGYVGTRLEDVLTRLYIESNRDLSKAENGIILVDEFDKMVDGSSHDSVGGVELQQEFLKLIEGGNHICKAGFDRDASRIQLKTDNILFLFAGAFVKLEEIIKKRMQQKQIGYGKQSEISKDAIFQEALHEDIIAFGIIPELVSRIQSIAALKELSEEELFQILKTESNPYISSLKKYISFHESTLIFEDEALKIVASHAHKKRLGARGLRGVIDRIALSLKFEAPRSKGKEFVITADFVKNLL
ncbi:AAA family ATPase [bacterium]|nr:AAA family ATPase [bacterium]